MEESFSIVILNHGDFGKELVRSAELIVGKIDDIYTVSLNSGVSIEDYYAQAKEIISKLKGEIILLTDLHGGTPSNVASILQREFKLMVLCGVNLPMLLELVCAKNFDKSLEELIPNVIEMSKKSIFLSEPIVVE